MVSGDDDEFEDAESEPDEALRVYTHEEAPQDDLEDLKPQKTGQSSAKSFVTASSSRERTAGEEGEAGPSQEQEASSSHVPTSQEEGDKTQGKRPVSTVDSANGGRTSTVGEPSVDAVSTTSLLRMADRNKASLDVDPKSPTKGILARVKRRSESGPSDTGSPLERAGDTLSRKKTNLRNLVKFDIPEDSKRASVHFRAKKAQMTIQRASTKLRRRKIEDGLVLKMERMLVRVDSAGQEVPDEFDENSSQKIDSRVKDKWREYMVVCRHSTLEDADFVLQMYKTRVCYSYTCLESY